MDVRPPEEIWSSALEEGERRLARSLRGMATTGLIGGADIMLGILALVAVTSALETRTSSEIAHLGGSVAFAIGFVFLTIGRSELFTENFLVPVIAVYGGRGSIRSLASLWGLSLVFNLVAMAALAWEFVIPGVFPEGMLAAAGGVADVYVERSFVAAFVSALLAGGIMTLFTWFVEAAATDVAQVAVAAVVGFLLAFPYFNHAIVSFGEVLLGIAAGTSQATVGDLFANLGVAVLGNLIGGVGLVTLTRIWQVRGEPGGSDHAD